MVKLTGCQKFPESDTYLTQEKLAILCSQSSTCW